jgi:hypothetical protein
MLRKMTFYSLLVLVLAVAAYLAIAFGWSYSSGERAGWVQKFSRKGWVCKTWEGELAIVSMPGTTPEKFVFTVRDDAVAARINDAVGQRVRLHYEQHRGLPGDCFGETEYWVDSVVAFPDSPGIPGMTAPNPAPGVQPNAPQNPPQNPPPNQPPPAFPPASAPAAPPVAPPAMPPASPLPPASAPPGAANPPQPSPAAR